ncbi:alpha/beta-hydrolase [Diplogelasinospora grovesii]|uniref:Alpha/beta-hydrolase n=1 Tax=Diplogelasinospora grovesii TaxID=303347 RepID=A0AAN6NGS8_9PEZI|nr:alpha/beta-hydrolase [Diplogelasinospora grovesii]
MDNSQYGSPSAEWRSYSSSHPELKMDEDGFNDFGPGPGQFPNPTALRDAVNAAREEASRSFLSASGLDRKVSVETHDVPTRDGSTIPVRIYRPLSKTNPSSPSSTNHTTSSQKSQPAYLYFHGGGMLFGTVATEDFSCISWSLALGFPVISVCYRHTPDFTFPTQIHDAWDSFEWVIQNADKLGVDPESIVVGGISAGGCLTASILYTETRLAREQKRRNRVRGQLLIIPWLIHRDAYPLGLFKEEACCSMVQCRDAPILPKPRYDMFTDLFKVEKPKEERLMNVGLATEEELQGMPDTAFIVCGWDMLRDEAFVYADKLERLGVRTKKHIFPGLPHAFRKYPDLPSSKRWDDLTVESVQWLLRDDSAKGDEKGVWKTEIPDESTTGESAGAAGSL